MNAVLIILAVIAVVVIAAVFIVRARSATGRAGADEESTEPTAAKVSAPEEAPAAPPEETRAAEAESVAEAEEPETRGPTEVEARAEGRMADAGEATPEVTVEPAKPAPSPEELRERVESRLTDSERMLQELRDAVSGAESPPVTLETVETMEEGLAEVHTLAEHKKWGQAKDKGEALHAQLSLLLQSARREQAS